MRRLFLLPLLTLLSCCAIPFSSTVVQVTVPPLPESWLDAWGPTHYRIALFAPGDSDHKTLELKPGGSASITIPRQPPVVLLATPHWDRGGPGLAGAESMGAAGGIWPSERTEAGGMLGWKQMDRLAARGMATGQNRSRTSRVTLSFADGAVLEVVARLMELGVDVRGFDLWRVMEEARGAEGVDPFLLDTRRLHEAIVEGSMRASYVRPVEQRVFSVELPDGNWLSRSPFAPVMYGRGLRELLLHQGVNVLYSSAGNRIAFTVDSEWRQGLSSPP